MEDKTTFSERHEGDVSKYITLLLQLDGSRTPTGIGDVEYRSLQGLSYGC